MMAGQASQNFLSQQTFTWNLVVVLSPGVSNFCSNETTLARYGESCGADCRDSVYCSSALALEEHPELMLNFHQGGV